MTLNFHNKTVFITGASRGIGEATAREFAGAGANVVLAARSKAALEKIAAEIGDAALAVDCDVSRYDEVQAAMQPAVERFGGIDVLVNNAGVIEPIARLEDSDPESWGKAVDINLKGVYHCMRAVYGLMKQNGGGVIVNISSGAATSALEGWSHYCATKAGVLSLTRCADKEWSHEGIAVVGLSPGTVATQMQTAIRHSGVNPVSKIDWSQHISPQWAAQAVMWLATPAGRKYDGGDFSLNSQESRREVGLV